MKLLPSRRVLCTPYNHTPCHFMQSHIRKVYACLAVTCHLHFWQNDRGLLRATAVTRGWNGYRNRNKSQHRRLTVEKKFFHRSCRDSNPRPFSQEYGALPLRYPRSLKSVSPSFLPPSPLPLSLRPLPPFSKTDTCCEWRPVQFSDRSETSISDDAIPMTQRVTHIPSLASMYVDQLTLS